MLLSWYLGGTSANPNPNVWLKQGPARAGPFLLGERDELTTVTKRVPSGASGGATLRVPSAITENTTKRVVGAITASTTVRVPDEVIGLGPFLLLEGDSAGALAYEQNDHDGSLKLQGSY